MPVKIQVNALLIALVLPLILITNLFPYAVSANTPVKDNFQALDYGRIVVIKKTEPSGAPDSFRFTLNWGIYKEGFYLHDGQSLDTGNIVPPGTYTVIETVTTGWKLSSINIIDPSGGSSYSIKETRATISLAAGETVTVTFNNTQTSLGKIVLIKQTDPDGAPDSFRFVASYGGYQGGFTMHDGQKIDSGFTLPAGTYTIRETVPSGWQLSSIIIDDPSGGSSSKENTATISLAAGETVTVTYNNTQTALGKIILIKQTDPDGAPDSFVFFPSYSEYSKKGLSLHDGQQFDSGFTLQAGTYTISETVPTGWQLASISITDPSGGSSSNGNTATISLAAGETVNVTYYDSKLGKIILIKQTDPDGAPDSFRFVASYGGYQEGVSIHDGQQLDSGFTLLAGTYTISETVPAGWQLAGISIDDPSGGSSSNGNTATISLAAGETVTVTCKNSKLGKIVLIKQTDPDGAPDSFEFLLSYGPQIGYPDPIGLHDGQQFDSGFTLLTGTYTISETVPSGWQLAGISIDDQSGGSSSNGNTATVSLAAGETVTVTYNNTKPSLGKIILIKQTDPDGTPDSFEFLLSYGPQIGYADPIALRDGQQFDSGFTLPAGTYTITETVPAGWQLAGISISDPSGGSFINRNIATVSLATGETVTVTYYNSQLGRIILIKQTDPDGAPDSFEFLLSYGPQIDYPDPIGLHDGQQFDSGFTLLAGTYTISETVPTGWQLAGISIDDPSGSSSSNGNTATVSLAAGETVTATYNNMKLGKIILIKQTDPDGAPDSFEFLLSYGPQIGYPDPIALRDGQQFDSGFTLLAGTYTITETVPAGWQLGGISIDDPSGGSSSNGNTATISLAAGETVTVTYNNTKPILTVTGVNPNSAVQGTTGLSVVINGTYLAGASAISFGEGITINSFDVNSDAQITANISISASAAPGARNVSVTSTLGTGTLNNGFTVTPSEPTVISVNPGSGVQGATNLPVIITGTGFTGATSVSFGAGITINSFMVNSATLITANITIDASAATGPRDISVTIPDGTGTLNAGFNVTPVSLPTITGISPASGTQGSTLKVTITGTNMTGAIAVTISGTGVIAKDVTVISDTQITSKITVDSKAATGPRDVSVTNASGTGPPKTGAFTVKVKSSGGGGGGGGGGSYIPTPTISSVTPVQGTLGVTVDSTIKAVFSMQMNAATLNTSSFTLMKGTIALTGLVGYDSATYTATFTPAVPLEYNTSYTVTVTTGARSTSGYSLANNYVWTFTTAAAPAPAPTPTLTPTPTPKLTPTPIPVVAPAAAPMSTPTPTPIPTTQPPSTEKPLSATTPPPTTTLPPTTVPAPTTSTPTPAPTGLLGKRFIWILIALIILGIIALIVVRSNIKNIRK